MGFFTRAAMDALMKTTHPEINRRLRKGEARKAAEYMELLGLDGFVQEQRAASDQFIPDLDFTGL